DAALARLRLRDETALVLTSDHGEGLGDHGETLHGFFVYQSTLRVPLFVRGPGVVPGTRLSSTVGLVDLFPTVLDLVGTPGPRGTHGRAPRRPARPSYWRSWARSVTWAARPWRRGPRGRTPRTRSRSSGSRTT